MTAVALKGGGRQHCFASEAMLSGGGQTAATTLGVPVTPTPTLPLSGGGSTPSLPLALTPCSPRYALAAHRGRRPGWMRDAARARMNALPETPPTEPADNTRRP